MGYADSAGGIALPALRDVVQLFKPVTWFPPMWAFMCGVVSSGASFEQGWGFALAGIVLAGPLLCASSQAINDWFDRHVDAINEPHRPIPSGRIPGRMGLKIAVGWTTLSLLYSWFLGPLVFGAACLGMILAWAYSAPPLRLKQNGVWGPATVAVSYEGLSWYTGAAVMLQAAPSDRIIALAALYSWGTYGIMVLNDFKAVEGDRQMNIRSLPVMLGVENAALVMCANIVAPQIVVIALMLSWGEPIFAGVIGGLLIAQLLCMRRLLRDPRAYAPWYNATGISMFVSVMLISAFAVS